MPNTIQSDIRCENCGCGVPTNATGACPACGQAYVGASVGALGARDYTLSPVKPGPYDVELGVSETLSWTFRLWADSLPRLAGLALIPYVFMIPFEVFGAVSIAMPDQIYDRAGASTPSTLLAACAAVALAVLWIVASLAAGAGSVHLVDEKAHGVSISAWSAFLAGLRHVGWLLLGWLLAIVVAAFAVVGPLAPIIVSVQQGEPLVALLALPGLATTALALVVGARLAPALPAIVVEDLSLGAALTRAWTLTRGKTGIVVGASLVFTLAWLGMSTATAVLGIVPILGFVAQIVVNALLTPLIYVFPFALYAGAVRDEQMRAATSSMPHAWYER